MKHGMAQPCRAAGANARAMPGFGEAHVAQRREAHGVRGPEPKQTAHARRPCVSAAGPLPRRSLPLGGPARSAVGAP